MRADPEVARLQSRLRPLGLTGLPGHGERTIVVLPSFDLAPDMLERHRATLPSYEERALYMLFLLRRPHVRIVLVTSTPVPAEILDYVLRLIPDTDPEEARSRLSLIAVEDDSPRPLAVKVLDRPDLVNRVAASIARHEDAFISPYNVAEAERELALRLGIPVYCPDDRFYDYGTKNGGRRLFAEVGVDHALGAEGVAGVGDLVREIAAIRRGRPGLAEVVVKQNDTVYGEGNVVVGVGDIPGDDAAALEARLREALSDDYLSGLAAAPGIVEEMLAGDDVSSPSVQQRIIAGGTPGLVCTHDQVLGGPNGQMYTGGRFPADPGYATAIAEQAARVRARLMDEGVVGRFGIDFVVTRSHGGPWRVFACEVNLREGGTSHPFGTLYLLTGGGYDPHAASYRTARGELRFYEAGDAIADERWRSRTPTELLRASERAGIAWDAERQTGAVFHMLRSLEGEGRYGATCIAPTAAGARELFAKTTTVLDGGG